MSAAALPFEASARPQVHADFPEKLDFLFVPARYKVPYGGRGSAKSWSIARALLLRAVEKPTRVLCAREFQNSITESVHQLLSDQITALGLDNYFIVQQSAIIGTNGSEFIFAGIRNNTNKIRSFEAIDICWVEEAEKVSDRSWEILIPTIRKPGSEIWVSFNPDEESDPTYQRFVVNTPPDAIVRLVNWTDNPWFPEVLRREKDYLRRVDPDAYEHVWNGRVRTNLSAQIFRGKYRIAPFDVPNPTECDKDHPMWDGPYYGLDFGFAVDPCALMKMWIATEIVSRDTAVPKRLRLMVEHEASGIGVEIDDLPDLLDKVPGSRTHTIRADNSRPETISHLARHGFRVEAADKWNGCVEDRIAFLRSFEEIIIHPRCKRCAEEARLYSYKRDRLTGDVLAEIEDRNNHTWDAIGYALTPLVQRVGNLGIWAALGKA